MHAYQVGKPYSPSVHTWPEGSDYNFRGGEHELRLFLRSPSRHEIEAVKTAPAEFGLYVEPPLISLCYKFEKSGRGIPWSDANYSWHVAKAALPAEAVDPPNWEETSPELRALLHVILVSAEDGIIRALRAVSFSPEFTRAFHKAIWEQAHRPWNQREYDTAQQGLYRRFGTSDLLVAACQHRTKGGS